MNEAKHTPGPWVKCREDGDHRSFYVFTKEQIDAWPAQGDSMDYCIAMAGLNHDNFEANARLIAAAPELLEALQAMQSSFHGVEWMEPHMHQASEMARSAIAKATGQPT